LKKVVKVLYFDRPVTHTASASTVAAPYVQENDREAQGRQERHHCRLEGQNHGGSKVGNLVPSEELLAGESSKRFTLLHDDGSSRSHACHVSPQGESAS
jgi:hypothetical protein